MLAYLKGVLLRKDSGGKVILDVQGVGYEVFISQIKAEGLYPGDVVELWIYSHIREDTFSLYGFFQEKEKEVFTALLGISGVGPKLALTVLSACTEEELMRWIEEEDLASIQKLPKVGKKTAQQMILALKGRWPSTVGISPKDKAQMKVYDEISSALLRLGFRSSEIKQALTEVKAPRGVQEGIRQALSILQSL